MHDERAAIYRRLMASGGRGDLFDRHLFACTVAAALAQHQESLRDYLGLLPSVLRLLMAAYFPNYQINLDNLAKTAEDAIEEEDFRTLLLQHRANVAPEEEWLAAIVARRAQANNHLWEDLGYHERGDLNGLFQRHFPSLYALNSKNMRWKKFFYRLMCESEGLRLCKSPNCADCPDLKLCFEAESPLLRRAV
ncbi:MAG TPA: nitrogen fixation protein NifQ [Candidatus Sulfotelmatobacter sp.]|jgi:nitrogen fixation protein NifQ|nr:nitrogen fixation protein NifQ [Candidatus Sulfotelmatobacter sp.]